MSKVAIHTNFKYLSDGRKVIVIGDLNDSEKIVQEIFVTEGGAEIPSGKNFTATNLHDTPVLSWKEKRIKKVDEIYTRQVKEREEEMRKLRKTHASIVSVFREKMKYMNNVCEKLDPSVFDLLTDYIAGEIKYIVISQYDPEIISMDTFNEAYEGGLRLISFFGRDDGTFTYAIGDYSDYSGSNKKFIPCRTKKEAIEVFTKLLLSKLKVNNYLIKKAKEYKIQLNPEKVKTFKDEQIASINKNILNYKDSIASWKSLLKKLK